MFWGGYDCQRTLVIRIAAITLASDSAITVARFRPGTLTLGGPRFASVNLGVRGAVSCNEFRQETWFQHRSSRSRWNMMIEDGGRGFYKYTYIYIHTPPPPPKPPKKCLMLSFIRCQSCFRPSIEERGYVANRPKLIGVGPRDQQPDDLLRGHAKDALGQHKTFSTLENSIVQIPEDKDFRAGRFVIPDCPLSSNLVLGFSWN